MGSTEGSGELRLAAETQKNTGISRAFPCFHGNCTYFYN